MGGMVGNWSVGLVERSMGGTVGPSSSSVYVCVCVCGGGGGGA